MKASPPVQVTRRGMMVAGGVIGVGFALVLIAGVFLALRLGSLVKDNQSAIVRIHRIERPTQDQTIAAVLRALSSIRSCARSPACRKRNPGVTRVARAIPRGSIPRRVTRARRRRTSNPSGGGSGGGSPAPGSTNPPPARAPAGPSVTGRRPQPTTRPSTPAPGPANPPAAAPQTSPKPQPAPAPTPVTPRPPPVVSVPPVPPVTVTVPPIPPIPPLPGVCTPVVGVNCPPNR